MRGQKVNCMRVGGGGLGVCICVRAKTTYV